MGGLRGELPSKHASEKIIALESLKMDKTEF